MIEYMHWQGDLLFHFCIFNGFVCNMFAYDAEYVNKIVFI